uniref:GH84 domain-containing protein n=1 Tax=Phasianus colchicus TaxID=9054 RepID=A0A669PL08_PHACC
MYAPKDELKHRLLWREPYTQHEAAQMQSLIKAAQEHDVEFIFAISAGQDIVFSSAGDRLLLQQKLRQVAALGCGAFALLFDDIDPCMCRADRDVFPSLAQAQASVANEAYRELGLPPTFLFCPTEYCSSLCSPSPAQSRYLQTLGRELLPEIGVIWTGPKVVSQELSVALVEEVEHVLQHRLLIWDNLFANDYDCRRVFLGPYTGRAPDLVPRLSGLLLNPNCELQANFIPIHTLGSWFRSELWGCAHTDSTGTEASAEPRDGQGLQEGYSPQEALELALLDWVAEIKQQVLEAGGRTPLQSSTGCEEEAGLHPGTAGGQEALLGPKPCDTAPSGADQHEPEPCDVTPGNRKREATSVPEEGNGSRTSTGGPRSPAEDQDWLTSGSRMSCEPSSALPITAGSDGSAGVPVADETLHSLGTPTCCSRGASTCQSTPLDSSDVRERGSSPSGSPQPGASTADALQIPSGSRADPSPGPISQLVDGATSPVPTALLTNGTAVSPILSVPLMSEEARLDSSAPLTMEEARMLVELFYLPYHHGPQAQHLLEDLQWLRANSPSVGVPSGSPNSCVVRLLWALLWHMSTVPIAAALTPAPSAGCRVAQPGPLLPAALCPDVLPAQPLRLQCRAGAALRPAPLPVGHPQPAAGCQCLCAVVGYVNEGTLGDSSSPWAIYPHLVKASGSPPSGPEVWPRCQDARVSGGSRSPFDPHVHPMPCAPPLQMAASCVTLTTRAPGEAALAVSMAVSFSPSFPLKGLLPSGPHHRAALPHMLPAGVKGLGRLVLCTSLCAESVAAGERAVGSEHHWYKAREGLPCLAEDEGSLF